jgi:uncharacterized protein (TIGR02246 family)
VDELTAWMDRYVQAWHSNDPADVAALFSHDAVYLTAPYRAPWRGREAIVAGWLEHKDEAGTWEFEWEPVIVADGLAIVQGRTTYLEDPPERYSNLWVVRLGGDGRCSEFTEWWMLHE